MDFELSDEHKMFRKTVRDFAEREIAPLIDEAEEKQKFPLELVPRAREVGLLGVGFPEEYGGSGGDMVMICILCEELSRVCSGIGVGLFSIAMGPGAISALGNEEQKRKYLPSALKGEKVFALGLTEPNAGSDLSAIETTAREDGENYILNGSKIFITNGTFADYVFTAAYTDKSKGLLGMNLFIVDTKTPGFSVTRKLDKLGHRSAETAELLYEDVRVPKENILGAEGGMINILQLLDGGRVIVAARALGITQAAYEAAFKYSQERVQCGRPISKFQVNRFKIARMAMEIDAARLLIYRAAWLLGQDKKCTKEASMAKLFASELAVRVAGEALHLHGGYGYIKEFPVERYFRDAKLCPITEGTSEIQHIVIARELEL